MMKHRIALLTAAMAAVLATGCTQMRDVVSMGGYERTVAQMTSDMERQGYRQTGAESKSANEISVDKTITYYNHGRESGYSQKMKNNLYYHNVYTFADSVGNQATVTTIYKPAKAGETVYLEEYELEGCKTTNPNDYARVCGQEGPVKRNLQQLERDTTVKDLDVLLTTLLVGGIAVAVSIVAALAFD